MLLLSQSVVVMRLIGFGLFMIENLKQNIRILFMLKLEKKQRIIILI